MNKKDLVLDFGSTRIICLDTLEFSTDPCIISQKDFFDLKFDEAKTIDSKNIGLSNIPNTLTWNEIPINILDVGAFNAPASAGEDLFWHSELILSKQSIKIRVSGLIYYLEYKMPKILDCVDSDVVVPLGYNVFYYLNQMFKKVTKTKPKNLELAITDKHVYFHCDDSEYYIVVERKHRELSVKEKHLDMIKAAFESIEYKLKEKTLDRVQFGKEQEAIFKHTCKALGDTISRATGEIADKYFDANGVLYLTKEK
jgi:hypothetical protein